MTKKSAILKDTDSIAPDELGHFTHHFSITMELEKHPFMGAMALIALVLIIFQVFKHGATNAASSSTGTGSSSTSSTPTSQPYILPTVGTVPVTVTNPVTITGSTFPMITVRQKSTSGGDANWDASHTGIPLQGRTMDNSDIGVIPFGTSLQTTGGAVTGSANHPASGLPGTTTWYPVIYNGLSGYVNAYDI